MRGVVLAGGTGSRLRELTRVTNKHMLPVYDRPMISHAIEFLARSGIRDVVLVVGGQHPDDFEALLGDGRSFGLRSLSYVEQTRAAGIADALALAEPYVGGEPLALLLGDNLFEFCFSAAASRFELAPRGVHLMLSEVEDPRAFGVATIVDDRIVGITEKPSQPDSRLAVAGLYLYETGVFDVVRTLVPSARGELEITDVNNHYVRQHRATFERKPGYWLDCGGSPRDLMQASVTVASKGINKPDI